MTNSKRQISNLLKTLKLFLYDKEFHSLLIAGVKEESVKHRKDIIHAIEFGLLTLLAFILFKLDIDIVSFIAFTLFIIHWSVYIFPLMKKFPAYIISTRQEIKLLEKQRKEAEARRKELEDNLLDDLKDDGRFN